MGLSSLWEKTDVETSVNIHQTSRAPYPRGLDFHNHRCEHFISWYLHILKTFWLSWFSGLWSKLATRRAGHKIGSEDGRCLSHKLPELLCASLVTTEESDAICRKLALIRELCADCCRGNSRSLWTLHLRYQRQKPKSCIIRTLFCAQLLKCFWFQVGSIKSNTKRGFPIRKHNMN